MPNHILAQQIVMRQRQVRLEALRAKDKSTDIILMGITVFIFVLSLFIFY